MAQKKKKNLLVFRFPKLSEREISHLSRHFKDFTAKQDFHVMVLFEGKGRKDLEIEEFGALTTNGSNIRRIQEELQAKLDTLNFEDEPEGTL